MNKKGFTLLELLMAAAIVTALASVAVVSYRAKIADAHIEDGKNQARALATAVRMFELEYSKRPSGAMPANGPFTAAEVGACSPTGSPLLPSQLVACNFLENRWWGNEYVWLRVCGIDDESGQCRDSAIVCMGGRTDNNKVPNKYRRTLFCVQRTGAEAVYN